MTNKLNTTKIGDEFESKSLGIIKRVIEEEQLGHLIDHLKIFQKKGYYSAQRKKKIKFDLTIEVWPPGANRYVLIYIIECKDYDKRVPVNKLEDFHSKILQVSGVNAKGIFISNSPLQEGGYNFAESVGMMFIQGESCNDYKIILHKTNREHNAELIPIIKETKNIELIDTGVEYLERLIDKKIVNVFISDSNESRVNYNIDRLSKEDIEKIAAIELNKIDPNILSKARFISIKILKEYLIDLYKINFTKTFFESELLGSCNIKNNEIGISESIKGTNRELFILSHELGHYLLHQKLSIGQLIYDSFEDSEFNFRTGRHDLLNPRHWIEWQANYFASSFLFPKAQFLTKVWKCQDYLGKTRGKILLDDNYKNINDFNSLVKRLSYLSDVSTTTIIYKLKELDLINDQSRLKSIGQIFLEYREELYI